MITVRKLKITVDEEDLKLRNAQYLSLNRVERHFISKNHELFTLIDDLSFKSKNLYNLANYYIRQTYIITSKLKKGEEINSEQLVLLTWINSKVDAFNTYKKNNLRKRQKKAEAALKNKSLSDESKEKNTKIVAKEYKTFSYFGIEHKYLGYDFLEFIMKDTDAYNALMAQVSQQILRLIDNNWHSFFEAVKDYKINPAKYKGMPKLPKYKHKTKGRFNILFTNQGVVQMKGYIKMPKCLKQYKLNSKMQGKLQQVRIKPVFGQYLLEVVYRKNFKVKNSEELQSKRICSIDLGIDNFATIVNNIGLEPIIIKGNSIKSANQYYNKRKAELQSKLEFITINSKEGPKKVQSSTSTRINRFTLKRNNIIDDFMHKASRFIVNYCIKNNIDTLVVGKNKSWKQKCNLGKTNNQNFVQIPFNSFIEKLRYKCQEVGIKFIVLEESYTSRSSFIDNDELPVYGEGADYSFSGKRIYRGLYRTRGGHLINADINAAYNILRKYDNIFSYTKNIKLTPRKLDLIKAKTVEDKIYANYCRELKEKMHKAKRVV